MCGSYASQVDDGGTLAGDEIEAIALTMGLRKWEPLAEKLVEVGLWERDGERFQFHNWEFYREGGLAELKRSKEANRARQKAFRDRQKAAQDAVAAGVTAGVTEIAPVTEHNVTRNVTGNAPLCNDSNALPDPTRPDPIQPKKKHKALSAGADVVRVFEAWREANSPKAVLDGKRRAVIERRLADGHSVETLCRAARGVRRSAWNMGENPDGRKHNGCDLVFRDADHIERFAALEEAHERRVGSQPRPLDVPEETPELAAARRAGLEALQGLVEIRRTS